jgi:hypothetical protein
MTEDGQRSRLELPGRESRAEFELTATVQREREALPQAAFEVPSMLSYDERAILHWAARQGFGAVGATVDLGCYLGGSTLPLGFGLRQAAQETSDSPTRRVHSFDLFAVSADWERIYYPEDFPFEVGKSFTPLYERHIAPIRELVQIYHGDLLGFRWAGEPISTLFIDLTKSWQLSDHVVEQFFPSLLPDAVVVHQDLVHWAHPWCAIVMEMLSDYVEFLGHVFFSSAVYRVREPIPHSALPTGLLERLSAEEALALVDRCAERIGTPFAGQVRLAGAGALACFGEFEAARARVRELVGTYDDENAPYISQGFERMPRWIDNIESGAEPVS